MSKTTYYLNTYKGVIEQFHQMNEEELKETIKSLEDTFSKLEKENLRFIAKLNCKLSKKVFIGIAKDIYKEKFGELD